MAPGTRHTGRQFAEFSAIFLRHRQWTGPAVRHILVRRAALDVALLPATGLLKGCEMFKLNYLCHIVPAQARLTRSACAMPAKRPRSIASWLRAATGAFVAGCMAVAAAASNIVVTGIQVDGKSDVSSVDAALRAKGNASPVQRSLARGSELEFESELIVPARTVITLKSSNGNTITLQPGSRFVVRLVSDEGESYSIEEGSVSLDVVKALNFFNVNYRRFLAFVRGTRFSVEVEPDKEIRFSVTEGTVEVQREVKVLIREPGAEDRTAEVVTSETLDTNTKRSVTYQLNYDDYLKTFDTLKGAEEYFQKQLEESEASRNDERIAASLANLINVMRKVDKPRIALTLSQRASTLRGLSNAKRFKFLLATGATHAELGEIRQALALFGESLDLARRSGIESAVCQSCALGNLAQAYARLGESAKALQMLEDARATAVRESHPDSKASLANTIHNMGVAYLNEGNPVKARSLLEESLAMRVKLYPNRAHPDTAWSYMTLGTVLSLLGDFPTASEHFARARAMQAELYPSEANRAVALTLYQVARHNLRQGRMEDAMQAIKKSVMLYEEAQIADSESVIRAYLFQGEMLARLGNCQAALKSFESAETTYRQRPPAGGSAEEFLIHQAFGTCHDKLGHENLAISAFSKAISSAESHYGSGIGSRVNISHARLATIFEKRGELESARFHLERIIATLANSSDRASATFATASLASLARISMSAGDARAAIAYLERAVAKASQMADLTSQLLIAEAQDRLTEAWTMLGDAEKAAKYSDDAKRTRAAISARSSSNATATPAGSGSSAK